MTPERRSQERRTAPEARETMEIPTAERRLSFGGTMDRVFIFALTALLGWLCVTTMSLKQDTTAILEHNRTIDKRMETIEAFIANHEQEIVKVKISMAEHGWKESVNEKRAFARESGDN